MTRLQQLVDSRCLQQRGFWVKLRHRPPQLPVSLQTVQSWQPFMTKVADARLPQALSMPDCAYPQHAAAQAAALNSAITSAEIVSQLPRLHNGRSAGHADLPAEFLRYAQQPPQPQQPPPPHLLAPTLADLFTAMMSSGDVPASVNLALVTPCYKRGSKADTANYRPIAVAHPLMRLYAGILNTRLLEYTEGHDLRAPSQAGFRPHQSVVHQIFSLQHLIDRQIHAGQHLYVCFLDLKSAYDRVSRPVLWQILQRLGLHGSMLQAVKGLYDTATVAVRINGRCGEPLESVSGVRQGCPLSPTLFGIFADGLHRFLQAVAAADGLAIRPDMSLTDLGYADDFCLVSAAPDGLQRLIDAAALWCEGVGMLVSLDKTVVMEVTGRAAPDCSWTCGGQTLRQVTEVRYLGLIFRAGQGFLPSLARLGHRAQAAWAQLSRQYGTLRCEKGIWLMLQLYVACVVPAGSFACELWGVWPLRGQHRKDRDHLNTVYLDHLSRLSGIRRTVATPILLEELGQQPLADMWLLRAAGFWNSLMSGSAFHKAIAQDAVDLMQVRRTKGWLAGLSEALQAAGYEFQPQQLECIDIGQLRSLLRDGRDNAWDGLDICPRTAPSRGAKQCTYGRWFRRPAWSAASPLKLPLTHAAMQRFLRFRTGCHGLPKDIGSQTGVPRRQRLCQLCGADYGDEMHLVFECHGLADLREQFASIFQERQTMQQFMWQPDMLQVAKFLDAGVKRMQEIDPDAGSNI